MVRHVSLDTKKSGRHARLTSGSHLRLNEDTFDRAMKVVGRNTEVARADFLDVTDRTVRRARQGIIGEEFIAKTLGAFKPHAWALGRAGIKPTFESFFELL